MCGLSDKTGSQVDIEGGRGCEADNESKKTSVFTGSPLILGTLVKRGKGGVVGSEYLS
jgi:hypothetical protein